jgi:hypothetical protein
MEQRTIWETNSRSDSEATPCLAGKPNVTTVFLRVRDWSLSKAREINPHSCNKIVFNMSSIDVSIFEVVVTSLQASIVQFWVYFQSVPFILQGHTFYPILGSPQKMVAEHKLRNSNC